MTCRTVEEVDFVSKKCETPEEQLANKCWEMQRSDIKHAETNSALASKEKDLDSAAGRLHARTLQAHVVTLERKLQVLNTYFFFKKNCIHVSPKLHPLDYEGSAGLW